MALFRILCYVLILFYVIVFVTFPTNLMMINFSGGEMFSVINYKNLGSKISNYFYESRFDLNLGFGNWPGDKLWNFCYRVSAVTYFQIFVIRFDYGNLCFFQFWIEIIMWRSRNKILELKKKTNKKTKQKKKTKKTKHDSNSKSNSHKSCILSHRIYKWKKWITGFINESQQRIKITWFDVPFQFDSASGKMCASVVKIKSWMSINRSTFSVKSK